jgi:hypothetical protein
MPKAIQFLQKSCEFDSSEKPLRFSWHCCSPDDEDIHRYVLDGKLNLLNESKIKDMFGFNFRNLRNKGLRPIGAKQGTKHESSCWLFPPNQEEMGGLLIQKSMYRWRKRIHPDGKIDLLLGGYGKLELQDCKSQPKPRR